MVFNTNLACPRQMQIIHVVVDSGAFITAHAPWRKPPHTTAAVCTDGVMLVLRMDVDFGLSLNI